LRSQIEDIEERGGSGVIKTSVVSQPSQDGGEEVGSREIDKVKNKVKQMELQIQKVSIELGMQIKEIRRGSALIHSQSAAAIANGGIIPSASDTNNMSIEDRIANLEQFKMITELNLPNLDDRIKNLKCVVRTHFIFIIIRVISMNLRSRDSLRK